MREIVEILLQAADRLGVPPNLRKMKKQSPAYNQDSKLTNQQVIGKNCGVQTETNSTTPSEDPQVSRIINFYAQSFSSSKTQTVPSTSNCYQKTEPFPDFSQHQALKEGIQQWLFQQLEGCGQLLTGAAKNNNFQAFSVLKDLALLLKNCKKAVDWADAAFRLWLDSSELSNPFLFNNLQNVQRPTPKSCFESHCKIFQLEEANKKVFASCLIEAVKEYHEHFMNYCHAHVAPGEKLNEQNFPDSLRSLGDSIAVAVGILTNANSLSTTINKGGCPPLQQLGKDISIAATPSKKSTVESTQGLFVYRNYFETQFFQKISDQHHLELGSIVHLKKNGEEEGTPVKNDKNNAMWNQVDRLFQQFDWEKEFAQEVLHSTSVTPYLTMVMASQLACNPKIMELVQQSVALRDPRLQTLFCASCGSSICDQMFQEKFADSIRTQLRNFCSTGSSSASASHAEVAMVGSAKFFRLVADLYQMVSEFCNSSTALKKVVTSEAQRILKAQSQQPKTQEMDKNKVQRGGSSVTTELANVFDQFVKQNTVDSRVEDILNLIHGCIDKEGLLEELERFSVSRIISGVAEREKKGEGKLLKYFTKAFGYNAVNHLRMLETDGHDSQVVTETYAKIFGSGGELQTKKTSASPAQYNQNASGPEISFLAMGEVAVRCLYCMLSPLCTSLQPYASHLMEVYKALFPRRTLKFLPFASCVIVKWNHERPTTSSSSLCCSILTLTALHFHILELLEGKAKVEHSVDHHVNSSSGFRSIQSTVTNAHQRMFATATSTATTTRTVQPQPVYSYNQQQHKQAVYERQQTLGGAIGSIAGIPASATCEEQYRLLKNALDIDEGMLNRCLQDLLSAGVLLEVKTEPQYYPSFKPRASQWIIAPNHTEKAVNVKAAGYPPRRHRDAFNAMQRKAYIEAATVRVLKKNGCVENTTTLLNKFLQPMLMERLQRPVTQSEVDQVVSTLVEREYLQWCGTTLKYLA